MGRRSTKEILYIESLVRKIKEEENETSPTEIGKILLEKYGKKVSKQTLLNMCSKAIPSSNGSNNDQDIELEYEDNPEIQKINERIQTLDSDFRNAVSVTDRCKLSNQLDSAQKSKLEMKKILREAEMLKRKTETALYIVKFGEPTVVKKEKKQ